MGHAQADETWTVAVAGAKGAWQTSVAGAQFALEAVQAAAVAALGSTGIYQPALPSVTSQPDLQTEYAVAAASSGAYQVTIWTNDSGWYHRTPYYGWSWGAWGWYGYDWGYWPWSGWSPYSSWLTSVDQLNLTAPSEQIEASVWNVGAQADEVSWSDSAPYRYASPGGAFGVVPDYGAAPYLPAPNVSASPTSAASVRPIFYSWQFEMGWILT